MLSGVCSWAESLGHGEIPLKRGRNCQTAFQSGRTPFLAHQPGVKVLLPQRSVSVVRTLAILVVLPRVRSWLRVERLFVSLLVLLAGHRAVFFVAVTVSVGALRPFLCFHREWFAVRVLAGTHGGPAGPEPRSEAGVAVQRGLCGFPVTRRVWSACRVMTAEEGSVGSLKRTHSRETLTSPAFSEAAPPQHTQGS